MLQAQDIYRNQAELGVGSEVVDSEIVSYESYLKGCRRLLSDRTSAEYYNWDRKRQNDFTDNLIIDYVRHNSRLVEGFIDDNNELIQDELMDRLRTDIIDFGILRKALEDDGIQEIQINDYKTIWVVRGGKSELYCDNNGKPYQFVSDSELTSTINRLIYNKNTTPPRMTQASPLINTRTGNKGYRLSGVGNTATTRDMTEGFDFPVTTVTIRKYAPSMLKFEDFERFGSLTSEISAFLRLCGRADIRLFCVGPTSSGKTTLLNAIVWEIPTDQRLLLIQNPTEIMIYDRSIETGANMRNVVHWEAQDGVDPDVPTTPSMAHFMEHALRNTPDVIIPGEVRTPAEFFQMNRALKTGHRVLTTFHASNGPDAVDRMATELSTLGGSIRDYANSIASSVDIVVSQMKLDDGSRHVMKVEELTGRLGEDGMAETRVLFQYTLTGTVDKDPVTGKTKRIHGYFEQVEPISDKLVQKFYAAGITKEELVQFLNPPKQIEGKTNLESQKNIDVSEDKPKTKVQVEVETGSDDSVLFDSELL